MSYPTHQPFETSAFYFSFDNLLNFYHASRIDPKVLRGYLKFCEKYRESTIENKIFSVANLNKKNLLKDERGNPVVKAND